MSAPINIKVNPEDLERAQRDLAGIKNGLPRAFARALNKTTTGVKTDMVALIRNDYNYKAETVRARFSVIPAYWDDLSARVISTGTQVHLTDVAGTRQTAKGVSVNVQKATGRQLIPRAFIRPGQYSGKMMVFRRAEIGGKMVPRSPIGARMAPHPEVIYNTPQNWATIAEKAQARLDTNFAHEVDVVLRGIA
jgi:hypothetical protein